MDIEQKADINQGELSEEEQKKQKDEELRKEQLKSVTRETFVGVSRYSPYLFININYFAHRNGFQTLSNFISSTLNLKDITLGLEVISQVYQYLEEDFVHSAIMNTIKGPLEALPTRISDEELKSVRKEEISRLVQSYEVKSSLFVHFLSKLYTV